jgi:amino acid permease
MLSILGIVALIVFPIQVYKTANGTGRSGALWALLTATIGVTIQFLIPIFIGVAMVIYYMALGDRLEEFPEPFFGFEVMFGLFFLFASIAGMWLVMRHVSKVPSEKTK